VSHHKTQSLHLQLIRQMAGLSTGDEMPPAAETAQLMDRLVNCGQRVYDIAQSILVEYHCTDLP
jgi:hypothetical protein